MKSEFDPYYKWLGIPPAEQPPNHYRLLGLRDFEGDAEVIDSAANRQMAHIRTFQNGQHAAESQTLLNELAAARITLLDGQRKASYDTVLKSAAPADAQHEEAESAAPAQPRHVGGKKFAQFELLEQLRASRFGDVYKARYEPTGRLVALKLLPQDVAANEEVLKRFRREIEITVNLEHPHLVKGYAGGAHEGRFYLVTELVVGTDLATLVSQQGPLPVNQAVEYLVQAARGLTQLHLHGVYHRNLKPHVLLVDMQGRVKVTNLFLARLSDQASVGDPQEELTRMGQMMGSVDYLAPEQAADATSADHRADIYALGCTLHFLLTGRPPYEGKSMMKRLVAHKSQPIPSLRAARSDVATSLDDVFQRMLAKDPQARYEFMGDVVAALEVPEKPSLWRRMLGFLRGGRRA